MDIFSHETAFASTYLLLLKIVGSLCTRQQGGKCSVVRGNKWLDSRLTYQTSSKDKNMRCQLLLTLQRQNFSQHTHKIHIHLKENYAISTSLISDLENKCHLSHVSDIKPGNPLVY